MGVGDHSNGEVYDDYPEEAHDQTTEPEVAAQPDLTFMQWLGAIGIIIVGFLILVAVLWAWFTFLLKV